MCFATTFGKEERQKALSLEKKHGEKRYRGKRERDQDKHAAWWLSLKKTYILTKTQQKGDKTCLWDYTHPHPLGLPSTLRK